jgi:hypothetical protein
MLKWFPERAAQVRFRIAGSVTNDTQRLLPPAGDAFQEEAPGNRHENDLRRCFRQIQLSGARQAASSAAAVQPGLSSMQTSPVALSQFVGGCHVPS